MSRRLETVLFTLWVIIFGAMSSSCEKRGRDVGSSVPGRDNGGDGSAVGAANVAYSSVGDPNVWFATFAGEMDREAKKRGYRFTVVDAQAKIDKQLADVEDLVARKPDVLILGPIDMKGSAPCLDIARKAGVPVIVVNRDIAGEPRKDYVTRLYSDFEWVGAKEAEAIAKAFGPNVPIQVIELHGTKGGGNTIGLAKGFREEMKKHKNMEIVASHPGNYNPVTALESMENVIRSLGGKFNAVFGHSDVEGVAAIQALKAKGYKLGDGKDHSIVVVSNGGLKDAIAAVKAGDLYATVTVSPYYANQVFDAFDAFKTGKSLPDYIRVGDFVIDASNVREHESFGF
jgi:ABC-type sugar transport system substrate-binding protein